MLKKLFYRLFRNTPPERPRVDEQRGFGLVAPPEIRRTDFALGVDAIAMATAIATPKRGRIREEDFKFEVPLPSRISQAFLDWLPPTLFAPLPPQLLKPIVRGKVFRRFESKPLKEAGEASKRAATEKRTPNADDPFEALFWVLLATENWDVRVQGVSGLLAAYPDGKKPFAFQMSGIDFLVKRKYALLADEMGLGKTIQAILAARALVHYGEVKRALVVCPKSLLDNWYHEFATWAPELSAVVAHGDNKYALTRNHHVFITNYETVASTLVGGSSSQVRQREEFRPFDLLIVDEGQNYKNLSTKRTRAALAIEASRRWCLTGTPLENRFDDYRSIWSVIHPAAPFRNYADDNAFLRATKNDVLRREKREVLKELPDRIERVIAVELDGQQLATYREMEKQMRRKVETDIRERTATQMGVLQVLMQLKQLCIVEPSSGESAKMEWIEEQLEEMNPTGNAPEDCEKALIFTQFPNKVWDEWKLDARIAPFNPVRYDGSQSDALRREAVRSINEDERRRVGLMSLKAGGVGLTLTRANHVIFLDSWWNPAVMDQAAARIHRIGQRRNCLVTTLVARDTIEERIMNLLNGKRELFEQTMKEVKEGKRSAADVDKLETVLSMEDMLQALGLDRQFKRAGT